MPRGKGTPKTGGRKTGSLNKVSIETKKWVQGLVKKNRKQLEVDFLKLKPAERWTMTEKLMSFYVPKQTTNTETIRFERLTDEQIEIITQNLINSIENED